MPVAQLNTEKLIIFRPQQSRNVVIVVLRKIDFRRFFTSQIIYMKTHFGIVLACLGIFEGFRFWIKPVAINVHRSEERRVGKEGISRWWSDLDININKVTS